MTSTHGTFAEVMLLATWAVLIAELVGDRSLYALASLALRFRWAVVFVAFTTANTIKIAIAILLAHAISHFHPRWTYLVSALAFFISAILIWENESPENAKEKPYTGWCKVLVVSFCAFFLPEWGDPGQIAAAALVLKFKAPLAIWLGATLGLMIKGIAAIFLGLQIRERLPMKAIRIIASASCSCLGLLAIVQSAMA